MGCAIQTNKGGMLSGSSYKRLARAYFEDLLNEGFFDSADQIFSPNVQFHYPLGDLNGLGEVKNYLRAVRTAFPDIWFTVADLIQEGDQVAARWSLKGTQSGTFKDMPPTNQMVSVTGLTVFNFLNDLIVEMWVAFDPARLTGE